MLAAAVWEYFQNNLGAPCAHQFLDLPSRHCWGLYHDLLLHELWVRCVGALNARVSHFGMKDFRKMAFSSAFLTPLYGLSQIKVNLVNLKCPNIDFLASSDKPNFGYTKSSFLKDGFSFFCPSISGFIIKPRSFSSADSYGAATEKTLYDFTVKDIDGKDVSLNKFRGKVLLIVNVASRCGLTTSNYTELSHLYGKYKTQGFEILAFPCNQFGAQEPGSNEQIKQFACTRFKAEFPIFDKVDVNGPSPAPVYQFLKSSAGGFLGDAIKWNFEKFLVDKNGKVVGRYAPRTSPFQIEKDIQKLLAA